MAPENTPLHRQLYEKLKHEFASNLYANGERLPSERQLSERYGVGRQVVRQALHQLQDEGFIDTKRGSGSYICTTEQKSNNSRVLGVIVPDFNLALGEVVLGIVQRARLSGFAVMVEVHQDSLIEFDLAVQHLIDNNVAAVLIDLPRDIGRFDARKLEAASIPYVLILRDDPTLICDKVVIDNIGVGELATQTLIDAGCNELLFIGPLDYGTAWNRLRGFRRCLLTAGLPYRAENVLDTSRSSLLPHEQAVNCMEQVVREGRHFNGICAFNDMHAVAIMNVLHARGIRVPDHVAVVGVDDTEYGRTCSVPLTSISLNATKAGSVAVDLAVARLAQPNRKPQMVPIEAEIVPRASCAVTANATQALGSKCMPAEVV